MTADVSAPQAVRRTRSIWLDLLAVLTGGSLIAPRGTASSGTRVSIRSRLGQPRNGWRTTGKLCLTATSLRISEGESRCPADLTDDCKLHGEYVQSPLGRRSRGADWSSQGKRLGALLPRSPAHPQRSHATLAKHGCARDLPNRHVRRKWVDSSDCPSSMGQCDMIVPEIQEGLPACSPFASKLNLTMPRES
jgi:hypothetical protein